MHHVCAYTWETTSPVSNINRPLIITLRHPSSIHIMSHLRQLLNILTNAIDTIEQEASNSNVAYPTVDDVFDPNSPSEQFATKSKVLEASSLGASAASQIFATLCGPGPNILSLFSAVHTSSHLC